VHLWLRLHQLKPATRMLFMAELGHRDRERCSLPSPRLHRGRPISICASTSESSAIKVTSSGEKLHAVMFAQATQVLSVLPQSRALLVYTSQNCGAGCLSIPGARPAGGTPMPVHSTSTAATQCRCTCDAGNLQAAASPAMLGFAPHPCHPRTWMVPCRTNGSFPVSGWPSQQ
jgi:hypothetical protein